MSDDHWTFAEWAEATSDKLARASVSIASEQDRADYLKVQVLDAVKQALRHGRSGLADDEPITP